VDSKGFLYISDRANHRIRKISPSRAVTTLVGSDSQGSTDGPVASATFHSPVGISVDQNGNVYVADNDKIRRISVGGVVSTLVDGASEGAQFHGLVVDNRGNVYFTDKKTHRIFKITAGPKRKISILAGTGYPGYKDGLWDKAYFNSPSGLAVCNISGDVYVADYGNHRIRRISNPASPSRQVVTIAGSGTKGDHDGVGIAACFNFPRDVCCHPDGVSSPNAGASVGALYVLDESHRLKKIDLYSGEVTSLIGTGSAGYRDVGSASFNYPRGMAMDGNGTIWVSDTYNHRIRKIMYWSTIDGEVL
jgi:sugar lactone lactonase YvrE